jgi:hypothetical protein
MKTKEFIERAKTVHGEKYDYTNVLYVNNRTKVNILCPKHGLFSQTPYKHINGGNGCPKCRGFNRSKDELIEILNLKHKNKYDYSLLEFKNTLDIVKVKCENHGVFEIRLKDHLAGNGCSKCSGKNKSNDEVINELIKVHGNRYDYSKVFYKKQTEKLTIICKEHGEFYQTYNVHKKGHGCPKCSLINVSNKKRKPQFTFIEESNRIHENKYDYSLTEYNRSHDKVKIMCKTHGIFEQTPDLHLRGSGCPICGNKFDKSISVLYDFLDEKNIEYIKNDTKILNGFELDIFIPEFNVAIEYNGLHWHCDMFKRPSYHLDKTKMCENLGIRLIHIFEDELIHKKNIVFSRINQILKLNNEKIYARNCVVREILTNETKTFLNENHIQGNCNSKIKIGLFYQEKLVSVMTFNSISKNMNKGNWELSRFSNLQNTNVVGGASKLLSFFIKKYYPSLIYSYADKRWSNGDLYEKLGFIKTKQNKPNYWYVKGNKRYHKSNFRKDKLKKQYSIIGEFKEWEIVQNLGYKRIWDCGTLKFELKLD